MLSRMFRSITEKKRCNIKQDSLSALEAEANALQLISNCKTNVEDILRLDHDEIIDLANKLEKCAQLIGAHFEYFGKTLSVDGIDSAIEACDLAERLMYSIIFARFSSDCLNRFEDVMPDDPAHSAHISIMVTSRKLQYYKYGKPNLDIPYYQQQDGRETFLYFRDFRSVRRIFVKNEYTGGLKEFYDLGDEPDTLSIEAALQRALIYNINILNFSGPCDLMGMTKISSQISYEASIGDWRKVVQTSLKVTKNSVILPSDQEGTIWEQREILGDPRDAVIVLIALPQKLNSDFPSYWEVSRKIFSEYGYSVPEYSESGSIVIFDIHKRARALKFTSLFNNDLRESMLSACKEIP